MPRYPKSSTDMIACGSRAYAVIHHIDTEHKGYDSDTSDTSYAGPDFNVDDEKYADYLPQGTPAYKPNYALAKLFNTAELECACGKIAGEGARGITHQDWKSILNSVKCLGCNHTVCADCGKADWRCGEELSEACVNELCEYAGEAQCHNMACAKQTRKIYGSLCPECYGCYTEDTTVCLNDNGIVIGGVVELILGFVDFDEAAEQVLEQEYKRRPISCTTCGATRYRRPYNMPNNLTCSNCP